MIAAEVAQTLRALLEGASSYGVTNAPSGTPMSAVASVCPIQPPPEGCPTQQCSMMYLLKLEGGAHGAQNTDLGFGVDWALVLDVVYELIEVIHHHYLTFICLVII